jgi:hypothetical protein
VVAGVSLYPVLIIFGPLAENFLGHHRNAEHLPDKVHHLFRPREPIEVAVDQDAVETVIYKNEKIAKQLSESVHADISHRKEKHRWAERSDGDQAKQRWRARTFALPKRSITFRVAPLNTTAGL